VASTSQCQNFVKCLQAENYDIFGNCKANSMNTAIVRSCEGMYGCQAWQTQKREVTIRSMITEGTQISFAQNSFNVIVSVGDIDY
jgi:hypothetical protein